MASVRQSADPELSDYALPGLLRSISRLTMSLIVEQPLLYLRLREKDEGVVIPRKQHFICLGSREDRVPQQFIEQPECAMHFYLVPKCQLSQLSVISKQDAAVSQSPCLDKAQTVGETRPAHQALGLLRLGDELATDVDHLKAGVLKGRPLVFRDTEELLRPKRVDYCHAVRKVEHFGQEPNLPQVDQAAAVIQDDPHCGLMVPSLRLRRLQWGS